MIRHCAQEFRHEPADDTSSQLPPLCLPHSARFRRPRVYATTTAWSRSPGTSTTGDPHIVVATPNGGHERSLPLPWPADDATWSPDDRKLMVTTFRPFPPGIRPAVMNPDGSGLYLLEMPELSQDTEVGCKAWSPGRDACCAR